MHDAQLESCSLHRSTAAKDLVPKTPATGFFASLGKAARQPAPLDSDNRSCFLSGSDIGHQQSRQSASQSEHMFVPSSRSVASPCYF